ncbi:hypothetical protein [Clostridium merdae]|uniref:hypothetical protein n=1 Tax=Clostridium merdae TaxID=1958780 RepID=UPI000A26BAB5|nr:hypothetical protein [Clostridium merdae]
MLKNRNKIRVIFWVILIVTSFLFGVGLAAFEPSDEVKKFSIIVFLCFVAISATILNLLWFRAFNLKLASLHSILLEEHDADRYIAEINELMEDKISPQMRSVLQLSLSAAYCEKRDFLKAKELLSLINPQKLRGTNRTLYWADYAYVHFHLKENNKAIKRMIEHQAEFDKIRTHSNWGALLLILQIFKELAEGNLKKAQSLLEQERPKWETENNKDDFEYLEKLCQNK